MLGVQRVPQCRGQSATTVALAAPLSLGRGRSVKGARRDGSALGLYLNDRHVTLFLGTRHYRQGRPRRGVSGTQCQASSMAVSGLSSSSNRLCVTKVTRGRQYFTYGRGRRPAEPTWPL